MPANSWAAFWRGFSAAALLSVAIAPAAAQGEVNIYSYREPALIEPLLKAFATKTGIKTNVVFAAAGLNERLAAEGRNSPADLLFTVDAGRLTEAKDAGLTQAAATLAAATLATTAIPAPYRDADSHWVGLTLRARVLYVSKSRVSEQAISYDDLADPKWKGRLCMRSGQHPYNTALLATIIAHKGETDAEAWAKAVKTNLARKPSGGDREAVRDVHAGLCDVALANTYYMAAMLKSPEQKAWADSTRIVFPDAAGRGTHINISGVALTRHAPNRANAEKLMAYLISDEGQSIYAAINNEYPVSPSVQPSELVQSWGVLKPDPLPLEAIAKNRRRASELMDKVAFDQGK
jgi:iron(III) transport system substrate-binding protein